MKAHIKFIPVAIMICLGVIPIASIRAQTLIRLEIEHRLNEAPFALEKSFRSNVNDSLEYDRFEYYLSEITLHFSTGKDTVIPNLWVLANASEPTNITLGYHQENQVDSVTFHVGVDSAHNHLDPTLWEAWHPLAPKQFSMHWGWTSGYRFAAVEGYYANNVDFEIHALDDKNYFATTFIPNIKSDSNATLQLSVYANYAQALRDIDVSNGLLTHGADDEAIDILENFRDHVFSKEEPQEMDVTSSVSTLSASSDHQLEIKLLSSGAGQELVVNIPADLIGAYLKLYNVKGRLVQLNTLMMESNRQPLHISKPGIYIVHVVKDEQTIRAQPLAIF
ncbi:MAG: hypothetical protein Salg2KO_17210 [Salibacteraceae bacterium]